MEDLQDLIKMILMLRNPHNIKRKSLKFRKLGKIKIQ